MHLFDDLAELRKVGGFAGVTDEALTTFEAAAELAIEAIAGPLGEAVEIRRGGSSFVILPRFAASIDEISEGRDPALTLADDDWQLRSDRRSVERLPYGTNPASAFDDPVTITVTWLDDIELRRAVAIALIKADLSAQPGVLGITEGNFTIQYANGQTYTITRDDVLEAAGPLWSFA